MVRYSVKPGRCDWNGGDWSCWLSGRDCDGSWTSGMDMVGTRFSCTLHKMLLEMPLGKCSFSNDSSTTTCAPNPEACEQTKSSSISSTSFTSFSRATSSDAETCLVETTQFGSCGADGLTCRFSPNDCPTSDEENSSWTFPHDACSCDKVQVGACQNIQEPSAAVCAVDSQACNPTLQTWIPVDEVQSTMGFDCFLCRPPKSNDIKEEDFTSHNNDGPTPSDETTINQSLLIGTIAGAVGFLALLLVATVWLRSRRRRRQPDSKTDHTPPASVVVANSTKMMEESSDDVSIL